MDDYEADITLRAGENPLMRERVALELAVLSRRRRQQLAGFGILEQLDRIAGTRVI